MLHGTPTRDAIRAIRLMHVESPSYQSLGGVKTKYCRQELVCTCKYLKDGSSSDTLCPACQRGMLAANVGFAQAPQLATGARATYGAYRVVLHANLYLYPGCKTMPDFWRIVYAPNTAPPETSKGTSVAVRKHTVANSISSTGFGTGHATKITDRVGTKAGKSRDSTRPTRNRSAGKSANRYRYIPVPVIKASSDSSPKNGSTKKTPKSVPLIVMRETGTHTLLPVGGAKSGEEIIAAQYRRMTSQSAMMQRKDSITR